MASNADGLPADGLPDWADDDVPPDHRSGFAVVVGRPNVGKSTLINQILGEHVSIVSPKPQTTRNLIQGILTQEKAQIIFVDTPGLHRPHHRLGKYMVDTATSAIPGADVVLFVVDVSVPPTQEDTAIASILSQSAAGLPVVLVLNKMDRLPAENVQPHTEAYWALVPQHAGWMMTVATQGTNLDKLLDLVVEQLPQGPRYYPGDQITDQTERQIAGELVREQVLRATRHEVPHAVAVVVEEFVERENSVVYVAATVYVERTSQRAILLGAKGAMLKRIGTAARAAIERMLGVRVFLDLHVKVRPDWRSREADLRRMGYVTPE